MMSAARRRRVAGFTLVETLVVLAILGLVFSVVIFARPRSSSLRMEVTTRALVASLRRARDEAMLRNVDAIFVVDAAARVYGQGGSMHPLPSDLTIDLTIAAENRRGDTGGVTFYPDGQSSGGTVSLSSGASHARIDVDWLTGLVQVRP